MEVIARALDALHLLKKEVGHMKLIYAVHMIFICNTYQLTCLFVRKNTGEGK